MGIIRGTIIKKNGKFWGKFPNRLAPPPTSEISDFFEFRTFLKKADPPIEAISDIFEIENILMAVDPSDRHLNWHI